MAGIGLVVFLPLRGEASGLLEGHGNIVSAGGGD